MLTQIGDRAPNLSVSEWVQGRPTNIDKERGNVVLVEVFQVNCPGCFIYGIPQAVEMYKKYYKDDLRVLGVATAFALTRILYKTKLLLTNGEVIGAPRRVLGEYGRLASGNKIGYKIPFQVAMDTLLKVGPLTDDNVMDFIEVNFPDFRSYVAREKESIYERTKQYLKLKQFSASYPTNPPYRFFSIPMRHSI